MSNPQVMPRSSTGLGLGMGYTVNVTEAAMNQHTIQALLERPIAYHAAVARAFGSIPLAVFWCQLRYWKNRGSHPEGWIYKKQDDIEDETALSRKQQETARALAVKLGVMEERRMGVPATMHFRITDAHEAKAIALMQAAIRAKLEQKPQRAYDHQEEVTKLLDSDRRDLNLIGYFMQQKGLTYETYEEFQVAIRRNLRAAKDLAAFSDAKIRDAVKRAKQEYSSIWTLETAVKILTNRNN